MSKVFEEMVMPEKKVERGAAFLCRRKHDSPLPMILWLALGLVWAGGVWAQSLPVDLLPRADKAVAYSGCVDVTAMLSNEATLLARYTIRQTTGAWGGVVGYTAADGSGFTGRVVPAWTTLQDTHSSLAGVTRWAGQPATFRVEIGADATGVVNAVSLFVRDTGTQKVVFTAGDAKTPLTLTQSGRMMFDTPDLGADSTTVLGPPALYVWGAWGATEQIAIGYVPVDPTGFSRVVYVQNDLGFTGKIDTIQIGVNNVTLTGSTRWLDKPAQFKVVVWVTVPTDLGYTCSASVTVLDASTHKAVFSRALKRLDPDCLAALVPPAATAP